MRIAIINCKSKKQKYACKAEEMYSISFQFKHQVAFLKQYYSAYFILSTKYGIISPTTIIEPYETTLAKGARLKAFKKLDNNQLTEWTIKVKQQITDLANQYDEIDLHISNSYLDPIKDILNNKIKHVKQPVNPGLVRNRYFEALDVYNKTGKVDLSKIGEIRKSKDPEIERWWYHPEYEPFFGYARHLCKKYPYVDEGNATRVSKGINLHTQGWVIDINNITLLHQVKGKWRVK
jgi:hypothetical protein